MKIPYHQSNRIRKNSGAGSLLRVLFVASALALPATAASWVGYVNVFDNASGTKGSFIFGSGWGVSDLKTTIVTSNPGTLAGDQLILQPNFNTYADNPGDPFWRDNAGAGPGGNKWMEANVYVETNPIAETTFTLQGVVDANDLDPAYQAQAFIKVLDPNAGFATVLNNTIALPADGTITVTSDLAIYQGLLLQTGFLVSGLNANPINEAALGSVGVRLVPEPSSAGLLGIGALFAVMGRRRKGA
ncbi:MAG: PEP-CTERM sorting domain-containing protein [Luteolibacter sp.]